MGALERPKPLQIAQGPSRSVWKHIGEHRNFEFSKNIFAHFSIVSAHLFEAFGALGLLGMQKIYFSKTKPDIKNLAREVLDIDLKFTCLSGFDHSRRSQ